MTERGVLITDFLNQRLEDFLMGINAAERENVAYIDEL